MTSAHQGRRTNDDAHGAIPSDAGAHLPHERDEKSGAGDAIGEADHRRDSMGQAHADVESDIQDTERIGTPNDVPSSKDNQR